VVVVRLTQANLSTDHDNLSRYYYTKMLISISLYVTVSFFVQILKHTKQVSSKACISKSVRFGKAVIALLSYT